MLLPLMGTNAGIPWSAKLDLTSGFPSGWTETRGTARTIFNSSGNLTTLAANVNAPDYYYDTVSGLWKTKGLLVEESRTGYLRNNVTPYTSWGSDDGGTKEDYGSALNGFANPAIAITNGTDHTAVSPAQVSSYFVTGLSAGVAYPFSIFVKAGNIDTFYIYMMNSNFWKNVIYGVIGNSLPNSTKAAGTLTYLRSVPLGSGVYRIDGTVSYVNGVDRFGACADSTVADSSIVILGAQVEGSGSVPTSIIPMTTTAATRGSDLPYITNPTWLHPSEFTAVVEFIAPIALGRYGYGLGFDDETTSNVIALGLTGTNEPFVGANIAGTTYLSGSGTPVTAGSKVRVVLRAKAGENQFFANGVQLTGGTLEAETVPATATKVCIGNRTALDRALNEHVKGVWYTGKALTTAECLTLSEVS